MAARKNKIKVEMEQIFAVAEEQEEIWSLSSLHFFSFSIKKGDLDQPWR